MNEERISFQDVKGFFASKINWLSILLVLVGLAEMADKLPGDIAKWVLVIGGCAGVILRTHYTDTAIAGGKARTASTLAVIAAIVAALFSNSCATAAVASGAGNRSPLEQAKLQYAAASLDYQAAMESAVELRRARVVPDEAWTIVENAQVQVRKWAPIARSALDLWISTGEKPASMDDALARVVAAAADVRKIVTEVRR